MKGVRISPFDDAPYIECVVRTSDGGFASSLRVPVASTEEQRTGFAKMWIEMLVGAMKNTPPTQRPKD